MSVVRRSGPKTRYPADLKTWDKNDIDGMLCVYAGSGELTRPDEVGRFADERQVGPKRAN